jgi:hypothetical protein
MLQLTGIIPTEDAAMATIVAAISAGLLALVAVKVGLGRNWARWVFVVVYVLGSLASMIAFAVAPQMLGAMPVLGKVSMVSQFVLQTIVLVLMFTRASRQWFAARH